MAIDLSLDHVRLLADRWSFGPFQTAAILLAAYGIFSSSKILYKLARANYSSPLNLLPGPKNPSLLMGNMRQIFDAEVPLAHEAWFEEFGPTMSYASFMSIKTLCTKDPKAMTQLINHSYEFPKPDMLRKLLARIFGSSVLLAEGNEHRRQRRIMNPCFGPNQVKDLLPIMYEKAEGLQEVWQESASANGETVDIMTGLSRATLDIIGKAGFDYEFNSLRDGEKNELMVAFMEIFSPRSGPSVMNLLQNWFPILGYIPTKQARSIKKNRGVMNRVGEKLISEKKRAAMGEDLGEKDLLSVLIRANMSTQLNESQRISNDELISQIWTLLIAGHETSSTSLTWLFYDLALPENQHIQTKLREECLSLDSSRPTADELNSLTYLDCVLRETLRKNAAVDSTVRCAGETCVIPVQDPYKDRNGVVRNEIMINKGDRIFIPLAAMNRDKTVWGPDALEFKPERWANQNHQSPYPGVYSGVMTFLGGPRSCIGYRMAVLEMKAIIFVIIRNIRFDIPSDFPTIVKKSSIVTRPTVKMEDGSFKPTMPLRLSTL